MNIPSCANPVVKRSSLGVKIIEVFQTKGREIKIINGLLDSLFWFCAIYDYKLQHALLNNAYSC
jgi:hypothetical protein